MAVSLEKAAAPLPARAEDLGFEKCLGRGYFGEVWRARERAAAGRAPDAGRVFAVKKVKLSLITENRLTDQLQREIRILYALRHPRIVRLHFDFDDGKHMYLGMEYATGGSLFDRLQAAGKFQAEQACRYFRETCEALDYLHHLPEKVIHRDIKPENILIDGEDRIKLADFGWANLVQADKRDTFCGTLDYLPPEMIMGTGHDESVDMWNMGVLLYELTTGQSPFGSTSQETTCRLILNVDLRFPADIDAGAKDLISGLCRKKPAERLTVRGAMEHEFVVKYFGGPGKAAAPPGAAPAAAAAAEAAAEDWGRQSVVARRLRDERGRINAEMEQLLKAKRGTEEALMRLTEDLELQHRAVSGERARRQEAEAASAELERRWEARELELEELRRRAADGPRAEAGRDGRGLGWFSRRATKSSMELA